VVHGETGLVAAPSPAALADSLDRLWADRPRTQALGRAGRQRYSDLQLGWSHVIDCLLY
jgi:glycosyltransferase involved in cell wall biosynthesis